MDREYQAEVLDRLMRGSLLLFMLLVAERTKMCLASSPVHIRSTHSYIACSVSENLGLSIDSTTSEATELSPLGQSVWVSKLYRDVPLEVQGSVFLANLMEFLFGEFDLILGMNWLVKYYVSLDYATKRAVLKTKEDDEVVMIGEHRNYLANVGMTRGIKLWVKKCTSCQKCKVENVAKPGLLQLLSVPDRAWSLIIMDSIEELPKSKGKFVILVVVDQLTKFAHFLPFSHPYTLVTVEQKILNHVLKLHGMLDSTFFIGKNYLLATFVRIYSRGWDKA
ncbi:protease [Gossypium australe]|uniref:Protease n=1 Tax=Gossypium australe TaxID=47621 RepID=A0A5B6WHN9_9ROSI|nr:protease [Gossypium australe]